MLVNAEAERLAADDQATPRRSIGRHFYDIHELLGDADIQQLLSDGQGGGPGSFRRCRPSRLSTSALLMPKCDRRVGSPTRWRSIRPRLHRAGFGRRTSQQSRSCTLDPMLYPAGRPYAPGWRLRGRSSSSSESMTARRRLRPGRIPLLRRSSSSSESMIARPGSWQRQRGRHS